MFGSNEWPPPGVARRPRPGSYPPLKLPSGRRKPHLSRLRPPQARNSPHRGSHPRYPLPKSTRFFSGKDVSREAARWEDLARDGSVLANETRQELCPGPSPELSELLAVVWRAASLAVGRSGSKPDSTQPPCMTLLGSVYFPDSPLFFFFSQLTVVHGAKQDPEVRSLLTRPERCRGEPGSSPGLTGIRKGNRTPLSFPAPSPPLGPVPPPPAPSPFQQGVTLPGASGKFL